MKNGFKKYIWMILGLIFFGIGTIGIILPILPTFPFYMITLFCFARSSEKVQNWFTQTKLYKDNVEKILKRKPIPLKSKLILIASFTITMGVGFYFMKNTIIGRVILSIVWFCHMIYFVFGIKTIEKEQKDNYKNL